MAQDYPSTGKRVAIAVLMGLGAFAMLLIGIDYSPPDKKTGFALITVLAIMVGFVVGAAYGRSVKRRRGKSWGLRPSASAARWAVSIISYGSLLGMSTAAAYATDTGYLTFLAALSSLISGAMATVQPPDPPGEETHP